MLKRGDVITIDGSSGRVMKGEVPMTQPELSGDFGKLMQWADNLRRMTVRTNADTPADARAARAFGAEGIGLCRTEHMFFEGDRIHVMREMILAESEKGRRAALDRLLPMQRSDFTELFQIDPYHRWMLDRRDRLPQELREYVAPKKLQFGWNPALKSDSLTASVGHACVANMEDITKFMDYEVGKVCPDDDDLAQKLLLEGCEPLPRRR